tara:strand:- start:21588 stop:22139 length:552 start_codon:yes stop_codon:yes gene_type:complete
MKKLILSSIASALFLSTAVQATETPSYDYLSVGFSQTNLENTSEDLDQTLLGFSTHVYENLFLTGSYGMGDIADTDVDMLQLGLGYKESVLEGTDLYGTVNFYRADVEGFEEENGHGLTLGVRHMLQHQWEINAAVNYADIGDNDDTTFQVGTRYYMTEQFSFSAGYDFEDNGTVMLGASYHF